MYRLFFCLSMLSIINISAAAIYEKPIKINGKKNDMFCHIIQVGLDLANGENNPFIHTDIFKYSKKGFIILGSVLETPVDSFEEIAKNNYVYVPKYTMKRTENGRYVKFGAIIVGTKNKSLSKKLCEAFLQKHIKAMKRDSIEGK